MQTLEELRVQALARLEVATAALGRLVHDRSTLNDDDEHDPDGAPLSAEWSRLTGLVAAAESELRQIEDAQSRVADGSYGVCSGCGERIPAVRLRVRPFADTCVSCSAKLTR